MHTVKLKISDNVYDKFLGLLSRFGEEEISIVREENENFIENQADLQKELESLNKGELKLLSQEELEERLKRII